MGILAVLDLAQHQGPHCVWETSLGRKVSRGHGSRKQCVPSYCAVGMCVMYSVCVCVSSSCSVRCVSTLLGPSSATLLTLLAEVFRELALRLCLSKVGMLV